MPNRIYTVFPEIIISIGRALGKGCCTVICPITDAFVGHHGALGGFVRVYCHNSTTPEKVMEIVRQQPGIAEIWSAQEAATKREQPLDREGDVAVMGAKGTVIGGRSIDHDLSALKGGRLRSHQISDFAINGTKQET